MIAGVVMIAVVAYFSLLPLIYRLFPDFDATRNGLAGFKVTVYIGESGVRVANGSTKPWRCVVDIGTMPHHLAEAHVEWGSSADVPYARFIPRESDEILRSAAREQVTLKCEEPSGITHHATLK